MNGRDFLGERSEFFTYWSSHSSLHSCCVPTGSLWSMHEGLVDEEVVLWVEEGEIWDPEVVATVEVVVDPSPPSEYNN